MLNAIFVVFGAALWATDALFRHPMVQQTSALSIVFIEHLFAMMIAAVWVFTVERKRIHLAWLPIFGAALIGIFGSALATLFFTQSFKYVNPSISILLQKIQPIIVIFLSWIFLEEKLSLRFFAWGAVALAAAFFMSFPHGINADDLEGANIRGVAFALVAAIFWAISTVIGKVTLKKMSGSHLTLWRFLFGFLTLWLMISFSPESKMDVPFITADSSVLRSIFFMALIPGFVGVSLYYRGLARLKASVATMLELAFPLCALFVNSRYLDIHLENAQLLSAGVLVFAIVKISRVTVNELSSSVSAEKPISP